MDPNSTFRRLNGKPYFSLVSRWSLSILIFLFLICIASYFSSFVSILDSSEETITEDPLTESLALYSNFDQHELAKSMKIYIYDLPRHFNEHIVNKNPICLSKMFASEIFFHWNLQQSPTRTLNPYEANWFYIPIYGSSLLNEEEKPYMIEELYMSAIKYVIQNFQFWNRTDGKDHFMFIPHDYGACFTHIHERAIVNKIPPVLQHVTLIQTFGHRNHVCMKEGSIIVPPYVSHAPYQNLIFSPARSSTRRSDPIVKRDIFAYFRGSLEWIIPFNATYSRGARQALKRHFSNHSLIIVGESVPKYHKDMSKTIFCLCPLGWAPWSPRLVESVAMGCIPVIISDDIVLPFNDYIPWSKFSVKVLEKDIPRLDQILLSIPQKKIDQMLQALTSTKLKLSLLYPVPAVNGDVFHLVLNSLSKKLTLQ